MTILPLNTLDAVEENEPRNKGEEGTSGLPRRRIRYSLRHTSRVESTSVFCLFNGLTLEHTQVSVSSFWGHLCLQK
jgi:hypothetical protein